MFTINATNVVRERLLGDTRKSGDPQDGDAARFGLYASRVVAFGALLAAGQEFAAGTARRLQRGARQIRGRNGEQAEMKGSNE